VLSSTHSVPSVLAKTTHSTGEWVCVFGGSQFTSLAFTGALEGRAIQISQDGKGRAFDNIFVERLWRTVKYEEVYLKDYESVSSAIENLERYFRFYNQERLHQSLNYRPPASVYFSKQENGDVKKGT
jgi:putative transposase